MEERDFPVATLRPRRLIGRLAAARGAFGRWLRSRLRAAFTGRHAPLLLTGVFFSGMMLAMGYLADRAQRAADGIDDAHRAAALERAAEARQAIPPPQNDPWSAAATRPVASGARVLFYYGP